MQLVVFQGVVIVGRGVVSRGCGVGIGGIDGSGKDCKIGSTGRIDATVTTVRSSPAGGVLRTCPQVPVRYGSCVAECVLRKVNSSRESTSDPCAIQ